MNAGRGGQGGNNQDFSRYLIKGLNGFCGI